MALCRWFSCGLPYQLFRHVWQWTGSSQPLPNAAWLLFFLPRCSMLLLSFVCDALIFRAARNFMGRSDVAHAAFARYTFALPVLVFMGRTFSNTLETAMLAAAVWIASEAFRQQRAGSRPNISALSVGFGALVGAAACVRLSFLSWAWPVGVLLILFDWQRRRARFLQIRSIATSLGSLFLAAVRISTLVAIPCAIAVAALCIVDSLFFQTLWLCQGAEADSCTSGIRASWNLLIQSLLAGKVPLVRVSFSAMRSCRCSTNSYLS